MDRFEELNDRLANRTMNQRNNNTNIKFDIRGMNTRNTFPFPIVEKKIVCKTKFSNITNDFNKEIDLETNLMNRIYPLQHGASQSVYVPSSTSDLYITSIPISSFNPIQPYPDLFKNYQYTTTNTNMYENTNFYNCSRLQRNEDEKMKR